MIQFERKILYSYLKVLSITLICFALLVINGLFSEAEMRETNQAVFHNSVSLWNIFMHNSLLFIIMRIIDSPAVKYCNILLILKKLIYFFEECFHWWALKALQFIMNDMNDWQARVITPCQIWCH